jgi:hypothetical protein
MLSTCLQSGIKMAVVIGSERNIKVTAEDNSTLFKSPTFLCSPADQVSTQSLTVHTYLSMKQLFTKCRCVGSLYIGRAGNRLIKECAKALR